ncbi:MAG TPA: ABC transporter permease [Candidatus Caccousia avistercoris]|nr:ABC transporter permease [Candidatus Caccousia avistercoris]
MNAIFRREFRAYFYSPIAYVFMGVVLFLFGTYYWQVVMIGSSYYLGQVYGAMFTWLMLFLPALTMRSLSEDRKNKTDQALITAPVSVTGIVWGKFLAAFCIYLITMAITLIPAVVIGMFSEPSWALVFGNFVASLLYGSAILAIGIFVSSLTESQIVALIGTIGISIFLMLVDSLGSLIQSEWFQQVVTWISFQSRYSPFTNGIFNISSVVFFLSVIAVFNFITARRLESRRWS